MPTDTERREVAQRLRELDYSDLKESLICAYLDALGIEGYENWIGIARRLADLIEPSCDRDALLEPAQEMVEAFRLGAFTGEGLDAKWCRELHDKYARRIREACGEVER